MAALEVLNTSFNNASFNSAKAAAPYAPVGDEESQLKAEEVVKPAGFWATHRHLILILPWLVCGTCAAAPVLPIFNIVSQDFFGSHERAALVGSFFDTGGAVLAFVSSALIGLVSDSVGRRPFLVLGALCNFLTALALWQWPDNLYCYLTMKAVSSVVVTNGQYTVLAPYLADVYRPDLRARAFGLVFSTALIPLMVLPWVARLFVARFGLAFQIYAALTGVAFVYAVLFVPESLSKANRVPFCWQKAATPFAPIWAVLSRPLVLVAGVILFLITVSGAGIAEFALYFLRAKFGFGVQENAVVFFEIALTGVFTQTVVLGALLRCTTEYNVLLLSVTCYALHAFGYAVAEEAWVVFAYPVALAAFGFLAFPALNSIVSRHFSETEQGVALGALQAVRGLGGVVGPIIFGPLYFFSSRTLHFPELTFLVAGSTIALSLPVAVLFLRGRLSKA